MTIKNILILIVLPIIIPILGTFIVVSLQEYKRSSRARIQKTRDQITVSGLDQIRKSGKNYMGYGLSSPPPEASKYMCLGITSPSPEASKYMFYGIPSKQERQTLEERRIEFERKNKEDWDSYHDPSRYIR